jgi:hypothetical protein
MSVEPGEALAERAEVGDLAAEGQRVRAVARREIAIVRDLRVGGRLVRELRGARPSRARRPRSSA